MPDLRFPLGLTSPLLSGQLVREAQRALSSNMWGDFKPGPHDSVFGEETARAVRRAKYWLGYEEENITGDYGLTLHSFLNGTADLSRRQIGRRVMRQHELTKTPIRVKALNAAREYIGITEVPPNSNLQKFGAWYGWNGVAWCAIYVSYCYVEAGSVVFAKGRRYAYCPYVVNDARAGRNNLAVTRDPLPGDLVLYDWAGDGVADHIGIFNEWLYRGREFNAVEGNTSPTNNSNGGAVMLRERGVNDVVCFVHVGK